VNTVFATHQPLFCWQKHSIAQPEALISREVALIFRQKASVSRQVPLFWVQQVHGVHHDFAKVYRICEIRCCGWAM